MTMRGRRSDESEKELGMIQDSGLQLALACGNSVLAKEFGLSRDSVRIGLQELHRHGFPIPALGLLFPDVMRENFSYVDAKFVRGQGSSKCFLSGFRKPKHIQTYLLTFLPKILPSFPMVSAIIFINFSHIF